MIDVYTTDYTGDKWDRRFMDLAEHVAGWSKDPSTKVGAIIADLDNRVVGMGYNGFPRGVQDRKERYEDRPVKYGFVVHAELNAILNARPADLRGCTLYVTLSPCRECAKAIIQSGIDAVYYKELRYDEFTSQMFREANIFFSTVDL